MISLNDPIKQSELNIICTCVSRKDEFLINKTSCSWVCVCVCRCVCVSMTEVYSLIESLTECIIHKVSELTNRATYSFIIYFTLQTTQPSAIIASI